MKKLLILFSIFFLFFLVGSVDAAQKDLGTFRQGEEIELIQTCNNQTAICDLCNITSVKYPNSTSIISNVEMTKRTSDFNYTIQGTDIKSLGEYSVVGFCQRGSTTKNWNYIFTVTPTGSELTTGQGILYFMGLMLGIFLFGLSLYGALVVPWQQRRSEEGFVIGINNLRYAKLFLWFLSYIFILWISFLMWNITYGFLNFGVAASFFEVMFKALGYLFVPIFITMVLVMTINFVASKKLRKKLTRGFKLR